MDARQTQFVQALTEFSQVENLNPAKPVIVKRTNSVLGKTNFFVCSKTEPKDLKLPMNVMWVDYNRLSLRYKQILKRVNKNPDLLYGTDHTYVAVTSFNDMWFDHFYDQDDEPSGFYDLASEERIGIFTLSRTPNLDAQNPVVVTSTDLRNTDRRVPLPHEGMHEEIPASMLKTATTSKIVNIANGDAEAHYALIANELGNSNYRKLHISEVHEPSPNETPKSSSLLFDPVYTAELFIPEFTLTDRSSGVSFVEARTFTVALKAFGSSNADTEHRRYLGTFFPNSITVRHNNVIQTISNNQFVANQIGIYSILAELVDVNGISSVQVEGSITVVGAI
jgi:hypothetical protein